MAGEAEAGAVWRTLWRWHFYAGLLSVPFIVVLALTGTIYLFKADYERVEEAAWRNLPASAPVLDANAQLAVALGRHPGATLKAYRLPAASPDAAVFELTTLEGEREVVVSPFGGKVLADLAPGDRLMPWIRTLHGTFRLGTPGDWLTELVASWAIVMVLTGLYLWWPRGRSGLAGIAYPRLRAGRRIFWRDLHAVTGIWVSGLALVLLLSALPWTGIWGKAFSAAKTAAVGTVRPQDWTAGHAEDAVAGGAMPSMVTLADIAAKASSLGLPAPVLISPPSGTSPEWTVRSDIQDRTRVGSVTISAHDGSVVSRTGFADKSAIDRVVGYGISWHEGVLFGRMNQAIGVLTALGLMTLAVSGTVLWWRRRPDGVLGAPPPGIDPLRLRGAMALLVGLALFLPLLGASLIVVALVEALVLRRVPPVARWLGLGPA